MDLGVRRIGICRCWFFFAFFAFSSSESSRVSQICIVFGEKGRSVLGVARVADFDSLARVGVGGGLDNFASTMSMSASSEEADVIRGRRVDERLDEGVSSDTIGAEEELRLKLTADFSVCALDETCENFRFRSDFISFPATAFPSAFFAVRPGPRDSDEGECGVVDTVDCWRRAVMDDPVVAAAVVIVEAVVLDGGLGVVASSAPADSYVAVDGFLRDDAFPYVVSLRLVDNMAADLFFSYSLSLLPRCGWIMSSMRFWMCDNS